MKICLQVAFSFNKFIEIRIIWTLTLAAQYEPVSK